MLENLFLVYQTLNLNFWNSSCKREIEVWEVNNISFFISRLLQNRIHWLLERKSFNQRMDSISKDKRRYVQHEKVNLWTPGH